METFENFLIEERKRRILERKRNKKKIHLSKTSQKNDTKTSRTETLSLSKRPQGLYKTS